MDTNGARVPAARPTHILALIDQLAGPPDPCHAQISWIAWPTACKPSCVCSTKAAAAFPAHALLSSVPDMYRPQHSPEASGWSRHITNPSHQQSMIPAHHLRLSSHTLQNPITGSHAHCHHTAAILKPQAAPSPPCSDVRKHAHTSSLLVSVPQLSQCTVRPLV